MDKLLHSGEFLSLLCAAIWSLAVIMFRRSGEIAGPVTLNLFKNTVGLILMFLTLLVLQVPLAGEHPEDVLILLGSGALGIGIADCLFFASLNRLGAVGNAIVDNLYSPFVVISAFFWLGEPVTMSIVIALGLMALAIVFGTDFSNRRRGQISGLVLGILSMVGMALGVVFAKPALDRNPVLWSTLVRLLGGVLFLVVLGVVPRFREGYRKAFTPGPHWKLLVPASIWGTYLAMMVWLAGIKYTSTGIASVLNQTSVLFTPILAAFLLRESMGIRRVIGVSIGFVGATVAALAPF